MKKVIYLLLITGILITFFGYRNYSQALHYPKNPDGNGRSIINVEQGYNGKTIAWLLKEEGLIKSEWAFNLYLKQ